MQLPKKTRKRLYEAEEPIEAMWPRDAPEPFKGHKYPVYGKAGKLFGVRVGQVRRRKGGRFKVELTIDNDVIRPMVGLQGVRLEDGSYESEPERIDAATEAEYAMQGSATAVIHGAMHRQEEKAQRKEARKGSSPRSERTIRRHQKSVRTAVRESA